MHEAPPAFSRGAAGGGVRIVGAYIAFVRVGDVDAARADGADGLCADDGAIGMGLVVRLCFGVHVVIADDVADRQAAGSDGADGRDGDGAGAVKLVASSSSR